MAIHLRTSKGYSPYHYKTTPLSPSHMFHSQTIPPLQSQGTSNYKTYTFLRCKHSDHQSLPQDRKSTRLNSSHVANSYAVFCLKKQIAAYQMTHTTANNK